METILWLGVVEYILMGGSESSTPVNVIGYSNSRFIGDVGDHKVFVELRVVKGIW